MPRTTLNQKVSNLRPSGIRKFFDIAAGMKDVISLGIGEPDFTTPAAALEGGIRALREGQTHYTSNHGILELRTEWAEQWGRRYGAEYDPASEVVITVGGSEALYLACTAILEPGDEVITPTPCFVSYQPEVILAGGVPVEVACTFENNFQPDPAALRAALSPKTRAVLINSPCNPTGAVYSSEVLRAIARMAAERDLVVIADEIYDRLTYGVEHECFAALPGMKERTILIGGFSKDYAMTGWRIGFAAAPEGILNGLVRVHQYTVMSAPTPAQYAALAGLRADEAGVQAMRAEYDRRRRLIVDGMNAAGLPTFEPRGAFYCFPKVSACGLDDEAFSEKLLHEEKVAMVPGSAFGLGGQGYARASYATAYGKIEIALERIRKFVNRQ